MHLERQNVRDADQLIAQGKQISNIPLEIAQSHISSGGAVTVTDNGAVLGTATTLDELATLLN